MEPVTLIEHGITIANSREIYRLEDIDRAIFDSASLLTDGMRSMYDKMRRTGGSRYVIRPASCEVLSPLYSRCPNFTAVLDDVKKSIALAIAGNEPLEFPPILLLGEAGVGKTHFAKSLAQALGTGYAFTSMNSLTAGWVLTGCSSQWSQAKPGRVAQTLVEGEFANPLIVLDEVDKAGGDARYDPMAALYTLFEPETSRNFKDEFIDIEIDASRILWVATANHVAPIPDPILNRMNVYEIPAPTAHQSSEIARQIYRDLTTHHQWPFSEEPPEDVIAALSAKPPREMRKLLLAAFGSAALESRSELIPADVLAQAACRPAKKIGF